MPNKKLKVLFATSELTPIAKTGGLGDVAGALPIALDNLGAEVKIFLPFYGLIDRKKYKTKVLKKNIEVKFDSKKEKINIWQTNLPNTKIEVLLIEHKIFSEKTIYSEKIKIGKKYFTDIEKFAFFSRAVLEATKALNWQPNIIHCQDWHTAIITTYLKNLNYKNDFFQKTKTIYTIHNLANQGIAKPEIISFAGLNPELPAIKADIKNGDINFMVQGILGADIVNTVSKTYAKEILHHYQGAGLDNILQKRKKDLYGIVNGIDTKFFNPATDKSIYKKYSIKTLGNKTKNKIALQKELKLPQDEETPIIGIVTRLVWQKGLELITEKFADLPCQFVFLGTGQKEYEDYIKKLAKKYPKKFSAQIYFDAQLAQKIYAGSDLFLVPSRFEPCGLTQMIAMRYGSVPVVRQTGGLADTVDTKVGFSFKKFDSNELYKTIKKALDIYYQDKARWKKLQKNGMSRDFSWNKSAKEYFKLYKQLLKTKK